MKLKMKQLIPISLLLVSVGCTQFQTSNNNLIEWGFESEEELMQRNLLGYARSADESKGRLCRIVTPRPSGINDIDTYEVILHELKHCLEGAFHN